MGLDERLHTHMEDQARGFLPCRGCPASYCLNVRTLLQAEAEVVRQQRRAPRRGHVQAPQHQAAHGRVGTAQDDLAAARGGQQPRSGGGGGGSSCRRRRGMLTARHHRRHRRPLSVQCTSKLYWQRGPGLHAAHLALPAPPLEPPGGCARSSVDPSCRAAAAAAASSAAAASAMAPISASSRSVSAWEGEALRRIAAESGVPKKVQYRYEIRKGAHNGLPPCLPSLAPTLPHRHKLHHPPPVR